MKDLTLQDMKPLHDDLLEMVRLKQPTLAPDVMRLPVAEYTDRERWEREVEMFRTTPMVMAFSSELREPGSYWAMYRVGVPVVLTRYWQGRDCRHTSHRVITSRSMSSRTHRKITGCRCEG